jgi:nicotinate-nucleotide--dimethylbenzimidazole phosphoribosyltransferase
VTADVTAASVAGVGLGVTAARQAGLATVVVDAGVTTPVAGAVAARPSRGRGDLASSDALAAADVAALVAAGRRIGADAAAAGLVAVGEVGIGNTTVAAALAALLLGVSADEVVGLGAGADTAMVERKRAVVAAAVERAAGRGADPLDAVAAVGGGEVAVLVGVILGAAGAGAPVVLDGLLTGVAALVATRLEPATAAHLVAGQRSREAAHPAVLAALGLEPLLDLRLRAGEGAGASFAAGLLLGALAVRRDTARVAEGGAGGAPAS